MKRFVAIAVVAIVCCVFTIISSISAEPQRQIAITFDDLPSVPTYDVGEMKALTTKLLKILKQNKVPAVGFVNEGKLHQRGETRSGPNEFEARAAILNLWVDAGFELGNHTYSHLDMFTASAEKFKQDLIAGEQTTQKLLAAKGMKLRYFRHPFLNTGASPEMKSAFDNILAERKYIIAPVTVDNQDYVFAAVYADALKNNDHTMMSRVAEADEKARLSIYSAGRGAARQSLQIRGSVYSPSGDFMVATLGIHTKTSTHDRAVQARTRRA